MPAPKKTAPKKAAPKKAATPRASTTKYIRNLRNMPVSLRLERHSGKARFELKPRGHRGDILAIQKEDLSDPIFQQNYALGLFEVLTAAEAADIMAKQVTNAQAAVHPSLAMITNELGEAYPDDAVKVELSDVAQAETVGTVDEKGNYERRGATLMEPGTPPGIAGAAPNHLPANDDPAFLSDIKARQRNLEGPQSIVRDGGLTPPKKG